MSEVKKCPKCGGEMEEGSCLVQRTWPPIGFEVQYVKRNALDQNARLKVTPFRCTDCGFTELYTEVEKHEISGSERKQQTPRWDENGRIKSLIERMEPPIENVETHEKKGSQ